MEGIIASFRRGKRTQKMNQVVIVVNSYEKNDKSKALVGKTATWKSPAGKEIKGKIAAVHGNKGRVRAIMEKGMPGQSIGTKVSIN